MDHHPLQCHIAVLTAMPTYMDHHPLQQDCAVLTAMPTWSTNQCSRTVQRCDRLLMLERHLILREKLAKETVRTPDVSTVSTVPEGHLM